MEGETSGSCGRHAIALAAILLVAAGLRVVRLNGHSLWFDEVITMTVARQPGPSAALAELRRSDATRAPLHPLLLNAWLALFGPSDLAGRSLSALLGVATVALVYWVGRQVHADRATATWAAALAAASPLGVQYSQEVRMYALLTLLSCLCWGLLFAFRRSAPLWKQAAFAAAMTALVYCHPLGALMVAALAVGFLCERRASRLTWGSWIAIHLALACAVAPWAINYLDHPPDPKTTPPGRLFNWPRLFIGGHSGTLWACGLLIAYGLLEVRPRDASPSAAGGRSRFRAVLGRIACPSPSLGVLAWFVVPPMLLYAYSCLRHPIFGPLRYLVYVGPAYLLLVARGMAKLPFCPRVAMFIVGVLATGDSLRTRVYAPDAKPDWRGAAAVVRRHDPRAPIVMFCREPHMYPRTVEYYVDPATPVVAVHRYAQELAGGMRPAAPAAWFLADRFDGALVKDVPEPLKTLYVEARTWTLHRVRLRYFRLRNDPVASRVRGKRG